jgi:hypothetical protein
MHASISGWDTAIIMAPLIGLLAFWMFGLDERVTRSKTRGARRRFCKPDISGGELACSDPDGKPWRIRQRKILSWPNRPGVVEILPPDTSAQAPHRRRQRTTI